MIRSTQDIYPWVRKMDPYKSRKWYSQEIAVTETIMTEDIVQEIPLLRFPGLQDCDWVNHAVSTRIGGVTQGCASAMNFSSVNYDTTENVHENYRRFMNAFGEDPHGLVQSKQTHTTNVRVVTKEDAGKGYSRERDYTDVDGLVTNIPGITLVTHYADCVPLFFIDPVHKAIGLSHSGWRGTVGQMGKETLNVMAREYGTRPEDVIAAIGPSICRDCYEVSEEVADSFRALLDELIQGGLLVDGQSPSEEWLLDAKSNGKYQLDLWMANRLILLAAGIHPEHLHVTDLCTCCNSNLLHSHRATGGKRGLLGAFLCIRSE